MVQKMATEHKYAMVQETFSGSNTIEEEYVIPTDKLYDGFYAGIYDSLVQGEKSRIPFEVEIIVEYIKRLVPEKEYWSILDIGCGTGDHCAEFTKYGAGSVTGLDKSQAMITKAKSKHADKGIDWKIGDAITVDLFTPDTFNLVTFFYFSIYYFPNRIDVFKNCYAWMKPGSVLTIHVVNRKKFDPILDSASPFPAFSLQKYSKERVMHSKVTFDKFEYEANFEIDGANARFKENFDFKDGTKRKQEHQLIMPTMEEIIKDAEAGGFRYRDYTDLRKIGYEYMYLVFLVK
jgi:SAM-dependent methyltransferase